MPEIRDMKRSCDTGENRRVQRGTLPMTGHLWQNRRHAKRFMVPTAGETVFEAIPKRLAGFFLLILLVFSFGLSPALASTDPALRAATDNSSMSTDPWYTSVDSEWGGHVKIRGSLSWPDDESYFRAVDTDPCYDGDTEVRLKTRLYLGSWGDFVCHYEAVLSGGNTRRKENELARLYPDLFGDNVFTGGPPRDERRLMDLTATIDENDTYIFYHRLDRLYVTVTPAWGSVRVGRQAVTWGNGFLFNPMDLFNPFAPSDIEREYKMGDDLILLQVSPPALGNFQCLYVPRRATDTGDVEWDQSSLAGKFHCAGGTTEFDFMAAKHYKDAVVGIGSTGYLGDAAWRADATWTFLDQTEDKNGFLSIVANIDYSWVWWKKNFYGFVEYFFNGLGKDNYTEALSDSVIGERIERGELFALGRHYLSGHVDVELHPLFRIYLTVVNNLEDPSGFIQPRGVWDIMQDVQITLGGTFYYGGRDTEYGGFKVAGTDFYAVPSDNVFLWIACYF